MNRTPGGNALRGGGVCREKLKLLAGGEGNTSAKGRGLGAWRVQLGGQQEVAA